MSLERLVSRVESPPFYVWLSIKFVRCLLKEEPLRTEPNENPKNREREKKTRPRKLLGGCRNGRRLHTWRVHLKSAAIVNNVPVGRLRPVNAPRVRNRPSLFRLCPNNRSSFVSMYFVMTKKAKTIIILLRRWHGKPLDGWWWWWSNIVKPSQAIRIQGKERPPSLRVEGKQVTSLLLLLDIQWNPMTFSIDRRFSNEPRHSKLFLKHVKERKKKKTKS